MAAALEQEFQDTPAGWAQRWQKELSASKKELSPWHKQCRDIDRRFRDKRDASEEGESRVNLFTSNIQILRAMLYGKTPQVEVRRRFSDSDDDVARVAGEMIERLLNTDIERDSDTYALALQYALDDRLLGGLGNARLRYVVEFEKVQVEAKHKTDAFGNIQLGDDGQPVVMAEAYEQEKKSFEGVETDYVHWKDQMWSAGARTFHEVRWWAFKAQLTREGLIERFGEDLGERIPLNSKRATVNEDKQADPWSRADIWEIWDKEHKRVFWYCEGFPETLDDKPDPLELEGFWPFPRPMLANVTTETIVPRPDFVLAQDLYKELDTVSTRITVLERAVKVAGLYSSDADGVQRILSENADNMLIPIKNWAAFAEKGGIKGAVDWFPLEQVVAALDKLRDYRKELVNLIYEVTGLADIVRGASQMAATATEQSIKAKFASIRVQALQDEFARFASDLQRIKAEIISKQFDPETIIKQSNIQYTQDMQYAEQAVQLVKDQFACYRVQVKSEQVSMTDYASQTSERTQLLQALPTYFQALVPLAQAMPGTTPMLLKIVQWAVAGLRGSSTIEAVIDQCITMTEQQAQQPQQPKPPDPKIVTEQMKQQGLQMKMQGDMQNTQMKHQSEMAKIQATGQADLTRIQAETQAEVSKQFAQMQYNVAEEQARAKLKREGDILDISGPGGG